MAEKYSPRKKHTVEDRLRLSGLEPLQYEPDPEVHRRTFINIGERCNVAGSSIYKKAIVDGDFDKALAIAVKQVQPLQGPQAHAGHSALHHPAAKVCLLQARRV